MTTAAGKVAATLPAAVAPVANPRTLSPKRQRFTLARYQRTVLELIERAVR